MTSANGCKNSGYGNRGKLHTWVRRAAGFITHDAATDCLGQSSSRQVYALFYGTMTETPPICVVSADPTQERPRGTWFGFHVFLGSRRSFCMRLACLSLNAVAAPARSLKHGPHCQMTYLAAEDEWWNRPLVSSLLSSLLVPRSPPGIYTCLHAACTLFVLPEGVQPHWYAL